MRHSDNYQIINSQIRSVCICMAGHARDFNLCERYMQKIINNLKINDIQVDLVATIWNKLGGNKLRHKKIDRHSEVKSPVFKFKNLNNMIENVIFENNFIQQRKNLERIMKFDPAFLRSTVPMYYLMQQNWLDAHSLINTRYKPHDLFIRVRPDLVVKRFCIPKELKHGTIYGFNHRSNEIWDYFFWGSYHEMSAAMTLFDSLPTYIEELNTYAYEFDKFEKVVGTYRGSGIFRYHMRKNALQQEIDTHTYGWLTGKLGPMGRLKECIRLGCKFNGS